MNNAPFNSENFEGTSEEIAKLNDAYAIAAKTWFEDADLDNLDHIRQLKTSLCDRIGNAYSEGLDAGEIAALAIGK